MMGKSLWIAVGMVAFSCIPLMGTRGSAVPRNPEELSFLERLRRKIPNATIGWDHHRTEYLETQGRIDNLLILKRNPDNIWNISLHRQRIWSLIFREMENMERFGRNLAWRMRRMREFAQAVMELEEAQQNGAPEEEITELHRATSRAWQNIVCLFPLEEIDANAMRLMREVEEDERYMEALQAWQAAIDEDLGR